VKILITGATGFIGSHLVDRFLTNNNDIKVIVRKSSNLRWIENLPVELSYASFYDISALEEVVKDVDYVYHVAGLTAAKNYDEFLKANRDATKNLLQACLNVNSNLKKFVLISSQTVAGPSRSFDLPVTENDTPHPITSYGKSKKEGEDVAISFMSQLPITIVRPPAVYGPRDTAIKDIFKTAKAGLGVLIGFSKKYVSLIHSTDLVRGIELAGTSEKSTGQIYFITSSRFYTWNEIMDLMKKVMNKKMFVTLKLPHFLILSIAWISGFLGKFSAKPPVFDYEKGIDFIQDYWTSSPMKAKEELGFVSEISIEDGIKETFQWYIDNKWI